MKNTWTVRVTITFGVPSIRPEIQRPETEDERLERIVRRVVREEIHEDIYVKLGVGFTTGGR